MIQALNEYMNDEEQMQNRVARPSIVHDATLILYIIKY